MDYFIIWVRIRLSKKLRSYRCIGDRIVLKLQLRLLIRLRILRREGIVVDKMVVLEFVEETGSLDGNSSIQETKNLVGVLAMVVEARGSRS